MSQSLHEKATCKIRLDLRHIQYAEYILNKLAKAMEKAFTGHMKEHASEVIKMFCMKV